MDIDQPSVNAPATVVVEKTSAASSEPSPVESAESSVGEPSTSSDLSALTSSSIRRSRKRRQAAPSTVAAAASSNAAAAATAAAVPPADPFASDFDGSEGEQSSAKQARTDASSSPASAAGVSPTASASLSAPVARDEFDFDSSSDLSAPISTPTARRRAPPPRAAASMDEAPEKDEQDEATSTQEQEIRIVPDANSRTPQTFLIHSIAYAKLLDLQTVHEGRMLFFASLVRSLRADLWPGLRILPPRRASVLEMEQFHSSEYLQCIQQLCSKYVRHPNGAVELAEELSPAEKEAQERFGLLDDCPPFPELPSLIECTVGGTLRAVECLLEAHAAQPLAPLTACHWGGGRHHAEAECAKGFCFCGDCQLACLKLSSHFDRVLYLDIDIHHGDGVEEAFSAARSVFTCSFHHVAPGFFPGTGGIDTQGKANAKHSLLNIPLRAGIDDATFVMLFDRVLSLLLPSYRPNVVVMVCGVDGLAHDRMSVFNLTTRAYARCVQILKKRLGHDIQVEESEPARATEAQHAADNGANRATQPPSADEAAVNGAPENAEGPPVQQNGTEASVGAESASSAVPATSAASSPIASAAPASWPSAPVPLLLLGGGGYNPLDSARAFIHMTAAACGHTLPSRLPDTERFLTAYLPNLSMHSLPMHAQIRPNLNDRAYLLDIAQRVRDNCRARQQQEEEEAKEEAGM